MPDNNKIEHDMEMVKTIGTFLMQERNANHISDNDLEKTKQAVAEIQRRIAKKEQSNANQGTK